MRWFGIFSYFAATTGNWLGVAHPTDAVGWALPNLNPRIWYIGEPVIGKTQWVHLFRGRLIFPGGYPNFLYGGWTVINSGAGIIYDAGKARKFSFPARAGPLGGPRVNNFSHFSPDLGRPGGTCWPGAILFTWVLGAWPPRGDHLGFFPGDPGPGDKGGSQPGRGQRVSACWLWFPTRRGNTRGNPLFGRGLGKPPSGCKRG